MMMMMMRRTLLRLIVLVVMTSCCSFSRRACGKKITRSNAYLSIDDFFQSWRSVADLQSYIAKFENDFPGIVKVSSIGRSAEKRSIQIISISMAEYETITIKGSSSTGATTGHSASSSSKSSKSNSNAAHKISIPKPGIRRIFLMGTLHGREWISPASLIYMARRIAEAALEEDEHIVSLLKANEIILVPLVNPDGYEFTRTPASKNEQARQWRKNRRLLPCKAEKCVHGIDLNRNWGIAGVTYGMGATRPTSDVYQGKRPFSEPEVIALRDWFLLQKSLPPGRGIDAVLDVHCCAATILPPSYYHNEPATLKSEHLAIASRIAQAMRSVNGETYKHRPREAKFSPTNSGIAVDWIYGEAGIKLVFIMETRGNEESNKLEDIFIMPPTLIKPIASEVEAGLYRMIEEVKISRLHSGYDDVLNPPPASTPSPQLENSVSVVDSKFLQKNKESQESSLTFKENEHKTGKKPVIIIKPEESSSSLLSDVVVQHNNENEAAAATMLRKRDVLGEMNLNEFLNPGSQQDLNSFPDSLSTGTGNDNTVTPPPPLEEDENDSAPMPLPDVLDDENSSTANIINDELVDVIDENELVPPPEEEQVSETEENTLDNSFNKNVDTDIVILDENAQEVINNNNNNNNDDATGEEPEPVPIQDIVQTELQREAIEIQQQQQQPEIEELDDADEEEEEDDDENNNGIRENEMQFRKLENGTSFSFSQIDSYKIRLVIFVISIILFGIVLGMLQKTFKSRVKRM